MHHSTSDCRLKVTVLICTYKRPDDLMRCIKALQIQERLPDEIVVVVQKADTLTRASLPQLESLLPLKIIWVNEPGLVQARNAALGALENDVVAMVDDDTVPHKMWLSLIERHFLEDPTVGGVGGRDRLVNDPECDTLQRAPVGIVKYWGQRVGNNHCGFGEPRETDTLKGANMSYRRTAIGSSLFDSRLRGKGSTPAEDLAFSSRIKSKGWKLIYDPSAVVDHYEGVRTETRHYSGMSKITDPEAFGAVTYNWVVSIWDHFSPAQLVAYFAWQSLVGNRVSPGVVQALRFMPSKGMQSWSRFWYTQKALVEAFRDLPRLPKQTRRDGVPCAHCDSRDTAPQRQRTGFEASLMLDCHTCGRQF